MRLNIGKAGHVSLLVPINPVTASWLGYTLNDEPVTVTLCLGTLLRLIGMAS